MKFGYRPSFMLDQNALRDHRRARRAPVGGEKRTPARNDNVTQALLRHANLGEVGMARKRIGILTGGGDVPGLNAIIKTVTYRGSEDDIEVIGLRRGWEGLAHLNCDDPASRRRYILPLDRENTRTIDRRCGTVLHSSRTNPSKIQKLPDHLASKDFPIALDSQGGGASGTWDLSQQVLANLTTLGI